MAKGWDRDEWIMNAIRRASYKYPPRSTAKINARRGRNQYECAICHKIFGNKDVELDHIRPRIDPEKGLLRLSNGGVDWTDHIDRALPELEGWQVLCIPCHQAKSEIENKSRRKR